MTPSNRFTQACAITKALAPATLAAVRGQTAAVAQLTAFATRPYPTAFLFHGATGTGKNCTGRALAGALGCIIDGPTVAQQIGGYWDLCGQSLTADDIHDRIRSCHYGTLAGSGWKCLVVSETDKMKDAALTAALFAVENLPPRTVWIFTTNEHDKLDRRFITRCEPIEFESRAAVLESDANAWLRELWAEAAQPGPAPTVADFPLAVLGGHLSYRALVIGLQSRLRAAPPSTLRPQPSTFDPQPSSIPMPVPLHA